MNDPDPAIGRVSLAATSAEGPDGLVRAVFERFPHGLLVIGADHRLVACNEESRRLLGRPGLTADGRQTGCCELLGCRTPDGPLQALCLTERTLADGRALPDIRIEARTGNSTDLRTVWVGAAPLGEDRVLLHLRPGRPGDRRRRTEPHWMAGPSLRLVTLGRTRVIAAEGPLEGAWLRQRTGQLLKLMICNRRRMTHSDEIAMTFWPDNERTGLQNVRHFVHGLRARLEPDRPARSRSSFVVAGEGGYTLDADRVSVDADEFEGHANAGLEAVRRRDAHSAQPALERALSLYGGDFLADEPYAEWAFAERARLHELACRALGGLADIALDAGAPETATAHLRRLARMEPLDSEIQQRLLRLLLARGRSGEAVRHYRHVHAAWMAAFDERPDFDLAALRRESRVAA